MELWSSFGYQGKEEEQEQSKYHADLSSKDNLIEVKESGCIVNLKIATDQTDLSQTELAFHFLKRSMNILDFCLSLSLLLVLIIN